MSHPIFNLQQTMPAFIDMSSKTREVGYVVINPELAALLLKKNTKNRHLSIEHAKKLAECMKRGTFETTHQGIAFDKEGMLIDGQHRLHAIIMSGEAVELMVSVGQEQSAKIDMGRKRSETDMLKITDSDLHWITNRTMATLSVLINEFSGLKIITLEDKAEYLKKYEDAFRFAASAYPGHDKNLCSAAIFAAFVSAYVDGADRDKLMVAGKALASGLNPTDTVDASINTILSLRNFLLTRKIVSGNEANHIVCYTTAQALKNYLDKKQIRRTMTPKQYPFTVYDKNGNAVN